MSDAERRPVAPRPPVPTRPVLLLVLAVGVAPPAAAQLPASPDPAALLDRAKRVLAPLEGDIRLPGLEQPVEVVRDRWGVPHITAKNAHDLFFAQGFVVAQDRLFQIDLWRRQATGELAEVFGPGHVEADRFARLMRYRGDMGAEWASYAPDARAIATAFTAGINAGIDRFGDKLPVEFAILGHRPKKWRPEDVLGRMSGVYMSQNFRNEIQRARLVAAVGAGKARWLAPVDPPRDYASPLGRDDLRAIDGRILAGYDAATKPPAFRPARTESNNWVVAGGRSASGKPLLASDPHRATALPSLRYLVHLRAPGWDVIGAGEPGLPGVAIGHNDRIAWGFTIVGADQADVYVEETNPADPTEYRAGGRWERMTVVREAIAVKGEKDQPVELRYTRHGPVLFQDEARRRAYALRWVGTEPGGAAYLASLSVARAGTWTEFLDALGRWKVPGLNFVYADVDGNIGWVAAARMPVRPRHDGLLPVPGGGGYEWAGYLPVRDLPQSFNPAAGWLATANHNILPPGYPHRIGHEFAAPYRYQRIRQALASKEKWDLADFRGLQHDTTSLPGLALARLLKGVDLKDPELAPYAKLLTEWDGRLDIDSRAGPLYAVWLRAIQEAFVAPHVPKDLAPALTSLGGLPVMLAVLESADPRWLGPDPGAARDRLLLETFTVAVKQLKALAPAKQARWGALHTVMFRHPVAAAFDVGPFERPGDVNTPNNTRYDAAYRQVHGATYRQLIDLADWDRAVATSAPGQSGQPAAEHYADLAPLWAKGEYFPLTYTRARLDAVARHRLTLTPGPSP
jgi:penicillin amidase